MAAVKIRRRVWPWIEGAILGLGVLLLLLVGGEAMRASYHGYLHSSIGQAVLREGLLPENPYHAGGTIRYYTLYPTLGPLLGKLGAGPIWSFAWLNVIAALLFGPAWDSFARAAGLRFRQRRASFWAAVLGFNALGWIGWLLWPPEPGLMAPVFSFISMTGGEQAWAWDARLQSFLPKFLNVSSFAMALPFMLWSMAPAMSSDSRAVRIIVPLALALALNPLAGGFAVICIALWQLPSLMRPGLLQKLAWPGAGLLAGLCALPFLLPLFQAAPSGESLTGEVRFQHNGMMNFVGPMLLLLYPGVRGQINWKSAVRNKWWIALLVAVVIMTFARLPWGNQYKLARIAGLLWAIPVGRWAVRQWKHQGVRRFLPIALLLLALPTTVLIAHTYLAWGSSAPLPALVTGDGKFELRDDLYDRSLPLALQEAEQQAEPGCVIWMHPNHPGTRANNGVVQGNALAPVLNHSLFVDLPQIHNNRLPDLAKRLELSTVFWEPNSSHSNPGSDPNGNRPAAAISAKALHDARAMLPQRSFLVVTHVSFPWTQIAMQKAAGRLLAEEGGFSIWQLPAMATVAGN